MGKRAVIVFLLIGIFASCAKKSNTTQNVANNCVYSTAMNQQVNFTILSGSTQFSPISIVGGYTYVTGFNPKGILIYHVSQNQFLAFDRSCTKDGCDLTNAYVTVQTGNTSVKDTTGCKSMFNIMDGSVLQGPATVGLYQYHTTWDGNQLRVYN